MAERRGPLGQYVKQLRERAGMTQKAVQLATDGHVKAGHLASVEVGDTGISPERAESFAFAVGATKDEWAELARLAGHEAPPPSPYDRLVELERLVGALEARVTRFEALFADLAAQVDRLLDIPQRDE